MPRKKTECPYEHCEPQISEDDFCCPRCGRGPESDDGPGCNIEYPIDGADDCDLIHPNDGICCCCGYDATGEEFTRDWLAAKSRKPCPHCDGKGYVEVDHEES